MEIKFKNLKMQRKLPRYKVNYEIKYSYNNRLSKCEIINISDEGMLLKIPQILEIGDVIKIFFDDTSGSVLTGVVRHKNYNYIGVSFIRNVEEYLAHVRYFINDIKDKNKIPRNLLRNISPTIV